MKTKTYSYAVEVWNCFAKNERFELVGAFSTESKARAYLRGSQFRNHEALITRLPVNPSYDGGIGAHKHWHVDSKPRNAGSPAQLANWYGKGGK